MKDNQNLLVILIILVTLNLATNIFTHIKISNDFSEQNINRIAKQAITENQKEVAKEILTLIGINPEKLKEKTNEAKLSSLKSNMHKFQTMLETYAVDWGGLYPDTSEILLSEAKTKNYSREMRNPFNEYNGEITTSYNNYLKSADKSSFKGVIIYEAINISGTITAYNIRGINEAGETIDLIITNQ